jgi:Mrp family chromosome partitioning ATPase
LWRLEARRTEELESGSTLGLLACQRGAGATTLAANLAVRASELQRGPVLLVETDPQRPRLAQRWRLPAGPGLSEVLAGDATLAECLREGPSGTRVLTPGSGAASGAWESSVINAFLTEARADHRLIVFDLPAADDLGPASLLARKLDQVVAVIRSEATDADVARRALATLVQEGTPLAGVVLNRFVDYMPNWLKR